MTTFQQFKSWINLEDSVDPPPPEIPGRTIVQMRTDDDTIERAGDALYTWIGRFYKKIEMLFFPVIRKIGVDNTYYHNTIRILAFITFLLIPLNWVTNYFLSYRLDPAKFFNRYSNYNYQKTYAGFTLFTFWTHKIATMVWTASIISHVLVLTLYGTGTDKKSPIRRFHIWSGIAAIVSSLTAAVSGIIIMAEQDARFNSFTRFFLYFPGIIVLISAPALILFETILKKYRKVHFIFGFTLLLPPLAMMIQFLTFSALLKTGWFSDEYRCWRTAMYISSVCGVLSAISFAFNAEYFRQVRIARDYRGRDMMGTKIDLEPPLFSPRSAAREREAIIEERADEEHKDEEKRSSDVVGPTDILPKRFIQDEASTARRLWHGGHRDLRNAGRHHHRHFHQPVRPVSDVSMPLLPQATVERASGQAAQSPEPDKKTFEVVEHPETHVKWLREMDTGEWYFYKSV